MQVPDFELVFTCLKFCVCLAEVGLISLDKIPFTVSYSA